MSDVETIARAICREKCAFYGEPPCRTLDDWRDGDDCDEPGCRALANAAMIAAREAAQ
jgi:hypothetical protein